MYNIDKCYMPSAILNMYQFYPQLVTRQQTVPSVLASHEPENSFSVSQPDQPSRLRSQNAVRRETKPSVPMTGNVSDRVLLTEALTTTNYKNKFLCLNECEMKEHERALERYTLLFA